MILALCKGCKYYVDLVGDRNFCSMRYHDLFPYGAKTTAQFDLGVIDNKDFVVPARCPYLLEHTVSGA